MSIHCKSDSAFGKSLGSFNSAIMLKNALWLAMFGQTWLPLVAGSNGHFVSIVFRVEFDSP